MIINSTISLARFHYFLTVVILFISLITIAQPTVFYNDGAAIGVVPNTIVWVGGDITNKTSGTIDNQGDIHLTGDWTNDGTGSCLTPTTGTIILDGTTQSIQGTTPTTFNNLDFQGVGTKTLNVDATVGGTSGILNLHANAFDLNGYTCTITNPSSAAIVNAGGYMISETTTSPYGRVQWDIGSTNDIFTIPFGTTTGAAIPFIYDVATAGSAGGNISVATYPTNTTASPNNRPLPNGVTDLNDPTVTESAEKTVDRFWIVDVNNFSTNPIADLTFTYQDLEWDALSGSTNVIIEDSLQAWRWDGSQWGNQTIGAPVIASNTVVAPGVDYSGPWTLRTRITNDSVITVACGDFKVPNAFSPNSDGHNDLLTLHGWASCVSDFSIIIFDRWGEKVFETTNPANAWDGSYKGSSMSPGVFVYYLNAKANTGENLTRKGNISLIK